MSTASDTLPLTLRIVSGPPCELSEAPIVAPAMVGRTASAAVHLPDPSVSRQHAELRPTGREWLLRDCDSSGGTRLNGIRLQPNQWVPVATRDRIAIGPWSLEVTLEGRPSQRITMVPLPESAEDHVERIVPSSRAAMARHQLRLLLECATATRRIESDEELTRAIVEAAVQGTGFERAALIRRSAEGDVEVLDRCAAPGDEGFTFSRSLVNHAAGGEIAMLSREAGVDRTASIVAMNISAALAIPVRVADTVVMTLYLDVRQVQSDAARADAVFCEALAGLAALALGGLRQRELEQRQRRIEADLEAAREVQSWLMPTHDGVVAGVECLASIQPGAVVSGDFFDAIALGHQRMAFWIGDVTGEGIAAGLLMTATQTWLRADLEHASRAPAEIVTSLNRFLCARSAPNRFVTLWFGLLDVEAGELQYVDAGHGHWIHRSGDGTVEPAPRPDSTVLGVDDRARYHTVTRRLVPDGRIVLYSDGLLEQLAPDGTQFGSERIKETIAAATSAREDVERLRVTLREFAGRDQLDDDVTIASVAW